MTGAGHHGIEAFWLAVTGWTSMFVFVVAAVLFVVAAVALGLMIARGMPADPGLMKLAAGDGALLLGSGALNLRIAATRRGWRLAENVHEHIGWFRRLRHRGDPTGSERTAA